MRTPRALIFNYIICHIPALVRNIRYGQGVKCNEPGATTEALPVMKGYWRASLDVIFIRKCRNEVIRDPHMTNYLPS